MTKRLRKPKLKEGELRIYWGRLPNDIPDLIYAYQGDSKMKRDVNLLLYKIGSQHPDPHVSPLFSKMNPSLIEELIDRGYDITTLKFSIMKKVNNEKS
jgi:hypothetical protein